MAHGVLKIKLKIPACTEKKLENSGLLSKTRRCKAGGRAFRGRCLHDTIGIKWTLFRVVKVLDLF
ncbi:MAG: hypothetical protein ACI9WL_000024 [Rubritalea sp.]|jgi:hypothetical protein